MQPGADNTIQRAFVLDNHQPFVHFHRRKRLFHHAADLVAELLYHIAVDFYLQLARRRGDFHHQVAGLGGPRQRLLDYLHYGLSCQIRIQATSAR
ncbi:hypothetical protein BN131_1845 [Cronobacter malonaticus 681]|nr:hypothetical protein BN131_1845 [Cronobacter malonaticus 681]